MTITTPDGRDLAFAIWGDPSGFPVLSLHGTPGSRLERWPHEELYRELGVCWVTHDRAGYGRSTRRRGRTVADEVDDVALLADHLGFDRFGVSGGSGGGPHALACAALLPERVVRASCIVVKIDDFAGHLASDPVQDISENILWLRDGVTPSGSR